MRLLVIGASGQVGGAVAAAAAAAGHEVLGGYVSRPPELPPERSARIDKSRPAEVGAAVAALAPEAIVDTGALHHVDYCESHPAEAAAVNRDGTAAVAAAAAALGARYLFVSTDYVFDGGGAPPYRETDEPRPLGAYGRSKLEGEWAALRSNPATVVVRPSVVFSWVPPSARRTSASQKSVNFAAWAIDELRAGRPLRIVDDQVGSPTLASDLAGAILALLERRVAGTFHAAGATAIDRYAFTRALAETLSLPADLVHPIATASLHQVAERPSNSALDSTKLAETTGHRMLAVRDALRRLADDVAARPA